MALTAEGRLLTDAHRRQQLALAARAVDESKPIWSRVLTAQTTWLAVQLSIIRQFHGESERLAEAYLREYREAEGVAESFIQSAPFSTPEMMSTMLVAGPYSVKNFIKGGNDPGSAIGSGFSKASGMIRRQVLSGGRMLIDRTAAGDSNAVGWRRVTDGDPCTFCAMLASRGPVYRSAEKAESIAGTGLEYHGHCGCTAEIVYGEWTPNELEEKFIDEYAQAAMSAEREDGRRTQNTVLWRMRKHGTARDSTSRRTKNSDD